jgi:hypothetical protein
VEVERGGLGLEDARVERDVDLHKLYDQAKSEEGVEKVFVLDGQQRLQTLFAIFSGGVTDGTTQRDAWIDVLSGTDTECVPRKRRLRNGEAAALTWRFSPEPTSAPLEKAPTAANRVTPAPKREIAMTQ